PAALPARADRVKTGAERDGRQATEVAYEERSPGIPANGGGYGRGPRVGRPGARLAPGMARTQGPLPRGGRLGRSGPPQRDPVDPAAVRPGPFSGRSAH